MKYSGDKLRAAIEAQGRRVSWVADQAGISFSTIYRVMDGSRSMSDDVAQRIAAVLDIPVEDLMAEQVAAA